MIAGTVVSGLVVGTASVMTDIPGAGAPEATAIEVPAGSEFDQSRDDTQADLPEVQQSPDASDVARVEAPQPDDLSLIDTDATMSAVQPETGDAEVAALNAPTADEDGAGIAVDGDSPVLPSPQAMAPAAPAGEEELSISTEPAQPAQPDLSEDSSAFPAPSADAPEETGASEMAQESTAPERPVAEPAEEDTGTPTVEVQDQVVTPQLPAIEAPESAPDAAPGAAPAQPVADQTANAAPQNSSSTIDDIAANVTTGRLPSVTAEPEAAAPDENPQDITILPDNGDLPPLKRYAAAFENPDGKPLMSIVLIDDGSSPIGLDALKSFPYPLSFAVDTGWSGAGEAMKTYRDAGFEVLAMIDLPEGAAAHDTEVSMQAYLDRVPQAVAVMEGEGNGLQSSRAASEQVAKILRDSGHGAVMFPNGLNTAQKLIAREGVPSASVFRDFDAKGQDATVIRRFLDQAAFRAGQEEQGVIMVGRLRADTISALLLWGLQDRASRVAVAPVSAVLSGE